MNDPPKKHECNTFSSQENESSRKLISSRALDSVIYPIYEHFLVCSIPYKYVGPTYDGIIILIKQYNTSSNLGSSRRFPFHLQPPF